MSAIRFETGTGPIAFEQKRFFTKLADGIRPESSIPSDSVPVNSLPGGRKVTGGEGGREHGASNDPAVQKDLNQLREAAGEVVGTVFYGTLMKMMRESKLKGEYGHGGRGEEVFSAQLHDQYAREMGGRQQGLADALYQRLEQQQVIVSQQLKMAGSANTYGGAR
ncbi:MAG: rod-binding protein [Phycisphaerae bacterium]